MTMMMIMTMTIIGDYCQNDKCKAYSNNVKTWKYCIYDISTGKYQSSSGWLERSRNYRNIYAVLQWAEMT